MRKRFQFLPFCMLLIFPFFSCETKKEIKSEQGNWYNPKTELNDDFSISLNIRVLNDDIFKVYYTLDQSSSFNENQMILAKVKGRTETQDIVLKLPSNVHPEKIRVDFGKNKDQGNLVISSFTLGYRNNFIEVPPFMLYNYFNHIEGQIFFDEETGILKISKENEKYLPIIWTTDVMSSKLGMLTKTKTDTESESTKFELSQSEFSKLISSSKTRLNIEKFMIKNMFLSLKGWACIENIDSKSTEIKVLLLQNLRGQTIETYQTLRPDVTEYFKLGYNADFSGFESYTNLKAYPIGNYKIAIFLKNNKSNKEALVITNKEVLIK